MQEFKFFQKISTIRWKTANGLSHPINTISTVHIRNIMNCLSGCGSMEIPEPYEGKTNLQWYKIFLIELKRRRDENI